MPDPNLRLLEEAATKLAPFLREIVFVGGVSLGLLITDKAAAPIRSTILEEIADSPGDLRKYLAEAARSLLGESVFRDVLPGFVLDEGRVPLILERLTQLTRLNPESLAILAV
jgi:hypothetical protein